MQNSKCRIFSLFGQLKQRSLRIVVEVYKAQESFDCLFDGVGGTALRAVEVGDAGRRVIHQKVIAYGIDLDRVVCRQSYHLVSLRNDALKAAAPLLRKAPLHTLKRHYGNNSQP